MHFSGTDIFRIYFLDKWLTCSCNFRKQNDSKSQQVKMDFYSQHQMTVEQYLAERIFKPQPPIYQHPLWQIACGQTRTLLKQPLLNQRPLKKPPQK